MGSRLTDSRQYAHLWSTPELDDIFDERARLQSWLDILVALAGAQGELGIIPADVATQIATHVRARDLDLDHVAEQTRLTGHSTLGLIHEVQRLLPDPAREYVYYGATVQDVTDTWFALVMGQVGAVVWRDLRAMELSLLDLAHAHRDTVMAGRTHGQIGSPISFGFKVASWADEIGRHLERLREGRPRWLVGQLAGAVGVLGFFEPHGRALRAEFCRRLGLHDPGISWLSSRDRVAEFGSVLAMVCSTLARVGNEVYELQRPEIGELGEPATMATVGSITMPHKRNPEASEHLDTLARLARAHAAALAESMVAGHERDGRAWKVEWVALPEVCLLTGVALRLGKELATGLLVDTQAMRANLDRLGDQWRSERLLAGLGQRMGKHAAQQLLHELLTPGTARTRHLVDAVVASGAATEADCRAWLAGPVTGEAAAMVDEVRHRATQRRATESETWP
jgi:adenylosuccinate lyase